ncbi:MAG: hypothetical protein Q9225_001922 [Loekoesia sp. 1 TL-2023]
MAFREMTALRLRNEGYCLSTFERCMDLLTSSYDSEDRIVELRASQFDFHVGSALAFELMGRKRFTEAYVLLYSVVKPLEIELHHHTSEFFSAVIELIKCCNFLSRETEGEAIALKIIDGYKNLLTGEQICNLQIVLVDSLIGQKKYERAQEVLLMVVQSSHISAHTHNIARLRLNKTKRRLGTLATLELFDGLSEVDTSLHDPRKAAVVRDEYFDELLATLSCTQTLQTLVESSESSIRTIQGLLLDPNARKDSSLMTKIALRAKDIGRNSSFEKFDQHIKLTTRSHSIAMTRGSLDGLDPTAQRPFKMKNKSADIPPGQKPQQRSHTDAQLPTQAMPPISSNMSRELKPPRQPLPVVQGSASADQSRYIHRFLDIKDVKLEMLRRQPSKLFHADDVTFRPSTAMDSSDSLRQEEWDKQAIVSFDGGGVKTYASLLILQELMNKIGDLEKSLNVLEGKDVTTASSFDPCPYKPTISRSQRASSGSSSTSDSCDYATVVPSCVNDLPNSSLYLPCHYFDFAVGTSTGGMVGIMLSRLRMTVDDCIAEYKVSCRKLFGSLHPLALRATLPFKLDERVLKDVMESISARHSEASEEYDLMFPLDEDLCKTMVIAYMERNKTEEPYFFRTYCQPWRGEIKLRGGNYGPPLNFRIWSIPPARLAVPKFPQFTMRKFVIGMPDRELRLEDGGATRNNPSEDAYYDIVQKYGGSLSEGIGPFISIGTGKLPSSSFSDTAFTGSSSPLASAKAAVENHSRTLHAHEAMTRLSDKKSFPYYRFGGHDLLFEVGLNEWDNYQLTDLTDNSTDSGFKTLNKINAATRAYLDRANVQKDLDQCAKLLVMRRRHRTRDAAAWDRYASASFYECSYGGCHKFRHNTAPLFEEHLRSKHQSVLADKPVEAALSESRRCWVYRNAPLPD